MKRPFVFRAIILPELAFCISVCKTSHYILPYLRGAQISACSPCCPVLPRAADLSASGTIQVGLVLSTGVCKEQFLTHFVGISTEPSPATPLAAPGVQGPVSPRLGRAGRALRPQAPQEKEPGVLAVRGRAL